jgi:hypothetical protein
MPYMDQSTKTSSSPYSGSANGFSPFGTKHAQVNIDISKMPFLLQRILD